MNEELFIQMEETSNKLSIPERLMKNEETYQEILR